MALKLTGSIISYAIIILLWTNRISANCAYGDGCLFPCRCQSDQCAGDNGSCGSAGCKEGLPLPRDSEDPTFDWGGIACQIGNVALEKTAYQSGEWGGLTADKAVDGVIGPSNNQNCAHPQNPESDEGAWLYVDLGKQHNIFNVTLINTLDSGGSSRLQQFTIGVGNTDVIADHYFCSDFSGEVERGGYVTLPCEATGQYVSFHRTGGDGINLVTICEFIIIGHPLRDGDCPAGKTGDFCLDACSQEYYGVNCANKCGNCDGECSPTNGHCDNGCVLWFYGDKCDAEIKQPNFNNNNVAPDVEQLNQTHVEVTWEQKSEISDEQAQFYGYIVQFKTMDNDNFVDVNEFKHTSGENTRSGVIPVNTELVVDIRVVPFRHMNGQKDRGWPSKVTKISFTTVTTTTSTSSSSAATSKPTSPQSGSNDVSTMVPTPSKDASSGVGAPAGGGADTGMIAGVVVAVAVVVALALAVGFLLLRRTKGSQKQPIEKPLRKKPEIIVDWPEDREAALPNGISHELTTPPKPKNTLIPVEEIEDYVSKEKESGTSDGVKAFNEEYLKLPKENYSKCEEGSKSENKGKNRFGNIKPFDATRVILQSDDCSKSDYINANYITGYGEKEEHYIAAQGPKPATVVDMWRMIWQKKINRIVMLTQLTEMGKKRCEEYWPHDVGSTKAIGMLTVTNTAEEKYADYAYRKFRVCKNEEEREVHQFHFLTWGDKTRLEQAYALLAFMRRVKGLESKPMGPLLVHCSAGVGRTGTFIAVDYLLEQAKAEKQVDVFECVKQIRMQRMLMVQLLDQYVFIYDALVESSKTGDTATACSDFTRVLSQLDDPDSAAHQQMEKEYAVLSSYKQKVNLSGVEGSKEKNKDKNRDPAFVPLDLYRPRLVCQTSEDSDYINAVYVDGYKMNDSVILTQSPLPETISDFWNLMCNYYGKNSNVIIMLNDIDEGDPTSAIYWPKDVDTPIELSKMKISLLSEDSEQHPNIIIRDIAVSISPGDDEPLKIRQFQMKDIWSEGSAIPKDESVLLELMDLVMRWQQNTEVSPITIHCRNGVERSGLYAAASYLMDMLKTEQMVDVFLTARCLTSKCPLALHCQEQYRFLYRLAGTCMSEFDTYSNFK